MEILRVAVAPCRDACDPPYAPSPLKIFRKDCALMSPVSPILLFHGPEIPRASQMLKQCVQCASHFISERRLIVLP